MGSLMKAQIRFLIGISLLLSSLAGSAENTAESAALRGLHGQRCDLRPFAAGAAAFSADAFYGTLDCEGVAVVTAGGAEPICLATGATSVAALALAAGAQMACPGTAVNVVVHLPERKVANGPEAGDAPKGKGGGTKPSSLLFALTAGASSYFASAAIIESTPFGYKISFKPTNSSYRYEIQYAGKQGIFGDASGCGQFDATQQGGGFFGGEYNRLTGSVQREVHFRIAVFPTGTAAISGAKPFVTPWYPSADIVNWPWSSECRKLVNQGAQPSPGPFMPDGLSRDDQRLWADCYQQHKAYKDTQNKSAELSTQLNPIADRLNNNKALDQDRANYCNLVEQQIEVLQKLHEERKRFIDEDCDKFDWFETGSTEKQRRQAHIDQNEQVDAQLKKLYASHNKFCPTQKKIKLDAINAHESRFQPQFMRRYDANMRKHL